MTEMESVKNIPARICPQIREIPLCDIRIKSNIREEYPGIDELAVSIRQHGLLQPITVYGVGCEGYFVKTGHRRYLAYQKLNAEEPERFNTILCMVSDAHNIEVIQIIENLQRRDLSAIEFYHALSSLRDQGLTLKQIAGVTGKSEKSIKNTNIYYHSFVFPLIPFFHGTGLLGAFCRFRYWGMCPARATSTIRR
jgi:ParB family chromosome partitioning protein